MSIQHNSCFICRGDRPKLFFFPFARKYIALPACLTVSIGFVVCSSATFNRRCEARKYNPKRERKPRDKKNNNSSATKNKQPG